MATVQSPEVAEVGNTDFKPPVGGGSVFTRKATFTLTSALAAADVIQMINVFKGETVLGVICTSADLDSGSTVTFDIGDDADPDYFVDGSTIAQDAGVTAVSSLATATVAPRAYTADNTLDILVKTGPTNQLGAVTLTAYIISD